MILTIKEAHEMLFEMAIIRGKYVRNPHKLNFSFYFSSKDAVEGKDLVHGIRVKPIFNSEKMNINQAGTLKLHSDWAYIPGTNDTNISNKDVKEMKDFFKTYKPLFCAVWEQAITPDVLYDYFRGIIDFHEVLEEFDFYTDYKDELDKITTIEAFRNFIAKYDLFNLWGD